MIVIDDASINTLHYESQYVVLHLNVLTHLLTHLLTYLLTYLFNSLAFIKYSFAQIVIDEKALEIEQSSGLSVMPGRIEIKDMSLKWLSLDNLRVHLLDHSTRYTLTHSLTHSLTHLLTYLLTYSLTVKVGKSVSHQWIAYVRFRKCWS